MRLCLPRTACWRAGKGILYHTGLLALLYYSLLLLGGLCMALCGASHQARTLFIYRRLVAYP